MDSEPIDFPKISEEKNEGIEGVNNDALRFPDCTSP